jgi:hypothetical protein
MTYEVVDTESSNILADFPTLEAAIQAISTYLDRYADQRIDDLAIAELDDRGQPTYLRPASDFIARA